jgi:PAS domain S-box-containing protein
MKKTRTQNNKSTLRKKAEKALKKQLDRIDAISHQNLDATVHELATHQIELEMQNEELRQAQIELETSRSKYEDLFDFAPIGYFSLDPKGRILEANLTVAELLGVKRRELLNIPFSRYVVPEELNEFIDHLARTLELNVRTATEIRLRKKDGTIIYGKLQSIPAEDNEEGSRSIRTALIDITAQKRAEENLQRALDEQRAIFNALPYLVSLHDKEGKWLKANPAVMELFGFDPVAASTKVEIAKMLRARYPDGTQINLSNMPTSRALIGENVRGTEYMITDKNGYDHTLLVNAIPLKKNGEVNGIVVAQADISDRKLVESRLTESERKFSLLFQKAAFTAVLARYPDGTIEDVNEAFTAMFGYERKEVIGKTGVQLGINPDPDARTNFLIDLRKNGFVHDLELKLYTKSGKELICLVNAVLLEIRGKNYHIATLVDITDRKRAELTLHDLNAQLEVTISQRTRFYNILASVSESIVRHRDRAALFNEVCRILVSEGGFRLAWIGLVDSSTREVRPTAASGEISYLEKIKVVARDVPEGRGPTGRAITEQRPVINLDFEKDENLLQWRELARSHGLRSSSAFPLYMGNSVIGALTLYSDRTQAFAGEEFKVLEAISQDLSFATKSLENEQKRQEAVEALRLSASHLEDLYNNAPCGYHSLSKDGTIVRINDTELRWIGYNREDVVGKMKFPDILTEDSQALFERSFPQFQVRGHIDNLEYDVKRRDGTIVNVLLNATAIYGPDGDYVMSRSTLFDITERKLADAAIRRLASAVEFAADAVAITDPQNGEIQYVNSAFERMTGYTQVEVMGKSLHVLDSGRQDEQFFREMRTRIELDGYWRGRLISRKKDGTNYFEECSVSLIKDKEGNTMNILSVRRDITEQLRLESIAESVNTMENIGYVFAGIRHEIGNPINSAKSILSVLSLKHDSLSQEKRLEYIKHALNEISRIERILGHLRSFNMYETPNMQTIDGGKFLREFGQLIFRDMQEKGIAVSVQEDAAGGFFLADPRALHQVLLNIVVNAVDSLKGRQHPMIDIGIIEQVDHVILRVTDNGCGMNADQRNKLFKPFYTSKERGTGLGLVITKKLMQKMGGNIEIESTLGIGTTVDLFLKKTTQHDL